MINSIKVIRDLSLPVDEKHKPIIGKEYRVIREGFETYSRKRYVVIDSNGAKVSVFEGEFEDTTEKVKLTIGIDPDFVKNGVAVVQGEKILSLESLCFVELIEYIKTTCAKDAVIKLENPSAIKPLFGAKAKNKRSIREKICQDVGKCKATGSLIQQVLESQGYKVKLVKPLKGPVKRQAKNDAVYFNKLTGWKGRSNEDKRDAALVALYG